MKKTNHGFWGNSQKKIDVLLAFGAAEELDTSLDKLIGFQIAKYRGHINQINVELRTFEAKYKMSSESFYRKFEFGEIGDDADYFEWSGLYENFLLYSKRIHTLEAALKLKK